MANKKRLTKSSEKVLGGVCGGIAEFIGWPKRTVRLLWMLLTIFTAGVGGVIGYLIIEMLMPESTTPTNGKNYNDFNIDDYRQN